MFSEVANMTHARYGAKSRLAVPEVFAKLTIVNAIATNRATISINATPGLFIPKKIQDHATFKTSWAPNSVIGQRMFTTSRRIQTSHALTAIMM